MPLADARGFFYPSFGPRPTEHVRPKKRPVQSTRPRTVRPRTVRPRTVRPRTVRPRTVRPRTVRPEQVSQNSKPERQGQKSREGDRHAVRVRSRRPEGRQCSVGGPRPGRGDRGRRVRPVAARPELLIRGRLHGRRVRLRRRDERKRPDAPPPRLDAAGEQACLTQPGARARLQPAPCRDWSGGGASHRRAPPGGGGGAVKVSGAQALFKALEGEGVDIVFGIPGGAILPAYDPLIDSSVRHVLTRHEQGAGHAAEGYAWATGKVGVCIATSGPGGCNLVTALADAKMDSVPMVAITGQVPTPVVGNDAFQEADITGITMPVTKHNFLVTDPGEVAETIREAFHIARTGRPGPVLVDIPKDVQLQEFTWSWPDSVDLPGYRPTTKGNLKQVRSAATMIMEAERPVLYVGGGVIKADAHQELLKLANDGRLPVTTTLMARGAFPDTHELALGMPGMHGAYTAVTAMQKADLLVALGSRFDDRVTGQLSSFAKDAKIIHVDVDPAEIGKNRAADVPIVGDCKDVIAKLHTELRRMQDEAGGVPDRTAWLAQLDEWKRTYPYRYDQPADGPLKPQFCIERLYEHTKGDAIVVAGVGQHQMWASQFWRFSEPRTWVNSGGLGTMGFAVPAALGAKAGRPDRRVIAIDGDGCFQMTSQELATSTAEGIPFVTAIINNAHLGMVRQWQELFYEERYSQVYLSYDVPDYVKLAEAYGCVGVRAEHPDEVDAVIDKALSVEDRSVVIDFRVDSKEMCFPMVPAGASNDDIIVGPEGLRPTDDPAEAPVA